MKKGLNDNSPGGSAVRRLGVDSSPSTRFPSEQPPIPSGARQERHEATLGTISQALRCENDDGAIA